MKIIKTTKLKILSHTKTTLEDTISIYNQALSFIVNVVNKEWGILKDLDETKKQINYVEKLLHKTKQNQNPMYNFDKDFYKFPSYLRRSCISEAIGIVSSYKSNYNNWLKKKEKALEKNKKFCHKPPKLATKYNSFPVFYKSNMFKKLSDNQAEIKVYKYNDWKWVTITYSIKNLKNRDLENYKELNPSLIRKGKKYFLHIPYQSSIKLDDVKKLPDVVIGVDLGLTNSAVCSAMNNDGTVIGRKFINQPVEKDRLKKALNKLSKANRNSGKGSKPKHWGIINGLRKQINQDTVNQIVVFAKKYNAKYIVFENLSKMKTPKCFYGAKKFRFKLKHWDKIKIQSLTEDKAHKNGIRISRVLARGTSKYAYDGSGEVIRNCKKDICKFSSGKGYHSDLNASYNIASRFYTRFILKPLSEMARLQLQAKVPDIAQRSKSSLASLISLIQVIRHSSKNTGLDRI